MVLPVDYVVIVLHVGYVVMVPPLGLHGHGSTRGLCGHGSTCGLQSVHGVYWCFRCERVQSHPWPVCRRLMCQHGRLLPL